MTDNLVNLKDKRLKLEEGNEVTPKSKDVLEFDFEAQELANKAKAEKLAKERQQNNRGVLRSYRIKNK